MHGKRRREGQGFGGGPASLLPHTRTGRSCGRRSPMPRGPGGGGKERTPRRCLSKRPRKLLERILPSDLTRSKLTVTVPIVLLTTEALRAHRTADDKIGKQRFPIILGDGLSRRDARKTGRESHARGRPSFLGTADDTFPLSHPFPCPAKEEKGGEEVEEPRRARGRQSPMH